MIDSGTGAIIFPPDLRVMFCIPTMCGGGAEKQLTYLAGELVAAGVQVHVAIRRGGVNLDRLKSSGANIHFLRSRHSYSPLALFELLRLLRKTRVHVLQSYLTQMDVLGGLSAKIARVPWILTERSSGTAYSSQFRHAGRRRTRLFERVRVQIGRSADAVVANSRGGAEYWKECGVSDSKLSVIPNGIALAELLASPVADSEKLGLRAGEPFVLSAGRFDDGKNPRILVEAFRAVMRRCKVRGVICGSGPLLEVIRNEEARSPAADQLIFPGYTQDLSGLMKSAAAFVSSSRYEGCPNAVLEAMAVSCPLIVSDIPGHREILGDDACIFVDPESSENIADGIVSALGNLSSTQSRTAAARKRVERMSLPQMRDRYLRLYTAVLPGSQRPSPSSAVERVDISVASS